MGSRGGSRAAATSKMERFVDVAAALDPLLGRVKQKTREKRADPILRTFINDSTEKSSKINFLC